MAIKFGRKQVGNPTPAGINFWIRVYTVIAAGVLGWMQTAPFISSKLQGIISSIIGLTIGICNALAPLFGTTGLPENIPIENVTAVDTDSQTKTDKK